MSSPTKQQELSVLQTLDRLLDYILEQRAVSFDQVHEYMLMEKLRFGPTVDPISIVAAHKDERIAVDYDQQMIYGRAAELAEAALGGYRRTG